MSPSTTERRAVNPWLVLLLVGLAQFMVVLDATITNVALEPIRNDLNFAPADLQWVVNGYALLFGGFLLLGGRAADLFGRRRLFLAGIGLFTGASLLNGLAQSSEMLIAARALQGLGAALVSPAALSILTTTFSEGEQRTRALGVWAAISAGGGAVGLLLGGLLIEYLDWRWVFFVNVPVGIAAIIASLRYVPESRLASRTRGIDLAGAATVTGGLVVLTYAIVKAESFGWTDWRTLGLAGAAAALLVAFTTIERRSSQPLVRLGIFRMRSLSSSNAAMLLAGGGIFSMFFFASLYLQGIKDYSSLETGIAFLPFTAGIVVGAGIAQQLVARIGVKLNAVFGMTLAAIGLLLLTGLNTDSSYWTGLLPAIVLMSVGMGNTFVPLTLAATANVGADDQGLASGIFTTAQQVGGALGLAILSTVASDRTGSLVGGGTSQAEAIVSGYQVAFGVGAAMLAVGAALILLVMRRKDVPAVAPEAALAVA